MRLDLSRFRRGRPFDRHTLSVWMRSPMGRRLLALEEAELRRQLPDVFGRHVLQIGSWGVGDELIASSETLHRAVFGTVADLGAQALAEPEQLPVMSKSVDAVVLPHTLEYEPQPHELVREVGRVLSGEGHLIVFGFRPLSSWGARHLFAREGFPRGMQRMIGEGRLRDWLKLLGFEVVDARRYLFSLPWRGRSRLPGAQNFFERAGGHLWPLFSGGYVLKARKRVYTLTPVRPRWRLRGKVVGGLIEPTTRM